jgi:NAD(P)H-binding
VTRIARHPEGLPSQPRLTVKRGDANDEAGLAALLRSHDAVISAGRFVSVNPRALIAAVKKAGVPRLLVVGGAGSLEVAPGVQLMDTPDFPAAYKPEALAGGAAVAIGGLLGQLTGGRWIRSALRQLGVVTLASGITFLVGLREAMFTHPTMAEGLGSLFANVS